MPPGPAERVPNTALRRAREQRCWSRDDLVRLLQDAGWAGCDAKSLARYESGAVRRPQYQARRALTTVFQSRLVDLGFAVDHEADVPLQPPTNPSNYLYVQAAPTVGIAMDSGREERDEMRRRTFSAGLMALGLAGTTVDTVGAAAAAGEAMRHGIRATSGDGIPEDVAEWEAIASEYSYSHGRTEPAILLRSYLSDLHQLNIALAGRDCEAAKDLYRVAAVLSSLTAWTYGNLGSYQEAGRWWRTAHRMASISRHEATQVWVAGQQGLMAIYQPEYSADSIALMLARVEPLIALNSVADTPGSAYYFCCKSQAFAMTGRAVEAEKSLEELRRVTSAIGAESDTSMTGWSASRLAFGESFAYSHLGNYDRAAAAQARSKAVSPQHSPLHHLKIELQTALCLAKTGAHADAAVHAAETLTSMPEGRHDLPAGDLARSVLRALPESRRSGDAAGELVRYVSTRKAISA